jgi:hypothetical protein
MKGSSLQHATRAWWQAARLLGLDAATTLAAEGDNDEFGGARPQELGLGAKFLPHHKVHSRGLLQ